MWLTILLISIIFMILIALGLVSYARWNFGSLEKLGIPVVQRDHFLLASALLPYQKPGGIVDTEHMKKYGSVFGVYHGREPQIVICDAELIRAITTKDSEYFDDKRRLDFGEPLFNEMVEFLPYERWKAIRNLLSPVLGSSVRMKTSNPAMTDAISDYITDMKQKMKESASGKMEKFAVNESIYSMMTDLLARSQYSIKIGKSDVNNRFVQLVRIIMSPPAQEAPWLASYVYAFPFLQKLLPNTMVNPEPIKEFCEVIKQLIDMRKAQNQEGARASQPKDFLDNLVDWCDLLDSPEFQKNDIKDVTIWSLGLQLFIGGQDQMSLILGSMFFCISQNPEVEKKVEAEVDRVFSKCNGVLDHDSVSDLIYLTACITEATRLYPFFFRTERVCTKDWKDSESGLEIKKGSVVIIGLMAANRNPKYFDDPESFNPDRFMPGNKEKLHAYAFTSFGFGPRGCPGKRMSMEIMLLLAAHLIKEFRFVTRNDSGINFIPAGPFFGAHEPIYLDVQRRNNSEE